MTPRLNPATTEAWEDTALLHTRRLVRLAMGTCPEHGLAPTQGPDPSARYVCTRRVCGRTWTYTDVRIARRALRTLRAALRRAGGDL